MTNKTRQLLFGARNFRKLQVVLLVAQWGKLSVIDEQIKIQHD